MNLCNSVVGRDPSTLSPSTLLGAMSLSNGSGPKGRRARRSRNTWMRNARQTHASLLLLCLALAVTILGCSKSDHSPTTPCASVNGVLNAVGVHRRAIPFGPKIRNVTGVLGGSCNPCQG